MHFPELTEISARGGVENAISSLATRIATIARRQHGLVTKDQLADLGLSAKQVRGWTANGRFDRVLPGVLRLAGAPITPEQALFAAVLWGGSDALVSHRSAGELWGYDGVKAVTREITVPAAAMKRLTEIVVHNTRTLATQRRTRRGLPITTPERTLVDLAGVLNGKQLEIAFESARRERLVTVASVQRALDRLGTRGRSGSEQLQKLLSVLAAEPPAESALEVMAARLLRESDLPKPQRQVEVIASGVKYRLDFAWPDQLVALECDGRKWHEIERDYERDRERWSAIAAATGYRFVFATWRRVKAQPVAIVAELRELSHGETVTPS